MRRRFPEAVRKLDQVLISTGCIDTLALKAAIAQAEGDLDRASICWLRFTQLLIISVLSKHRYIRPFLSAGRRNG